MKYHEFELHVIPTLMCETLHILLPTLNLIFPWGRNTFLHLGLWKHSNHYRLCKKWKTWNLSLIHLHAREHVPQKPFRSILRSSWGSHQLSDLEYGKISSSPICKILHDEELILLQCLSQDFGKLLLNFSDSPLNADWELCGWKWCLFWCETEWGWWRQW